jgi:4-amino-4-deoxy-L-arabinose transferase-like glycosyltransferase
MEGPVASTWMHHADPDLESGLRVDIVAAPRPKPIPVPSSRSVWHDVARICVLLVLAASIRFWIITHTEVAARDSIGFIRYAMQLEHLPWTKVLRESQQHPGYPIVLLAVSWPVRAIMGGTTPITMQLSAQIASALAGILLVLPMYFLGRDLLNRSAGFWGTALFQCLPVSARALSDGLSEATFLLFMATALLFAVRGLRRGAAGWFVLSGLCGGFAYLTRPEGALVVIASSIVLLLAALIPGGRQQWRRILACQAGLLTAALAAGLSYALIIGTFTNKPTPNVVLGTACLDRPAAELSLSRASAASPTPRMTAGPLLAVYCPENLTDRRLWAFKAIGLEVSKCLQYALVPPLLLGLAWFGKNFRSRPEVWILIVLCLLHAAVLWRLANVVGYVSDRHVLILVLCGIFTAAGAIIVFGNWLVHGRSIPLAVLKKPSSPVGPSWLALTMLVLLAGLGLMESLRTLHGNRAGHRAAGLWLAEHTNPADPITDPFCWAHYYAGRVFREGIREDGSPGYQPTNYVVIEHSDHDHIRLPTIRAAEDLAARGRVVYHWPEESPVAGAKILIYAVR